MSGGGDAVAVAGSILGDDRCGNSVGAACHAYDAGMELWANDVITLERATGSVHGTIVIGCVVSLAPSIPLHSTSISTVVHKQSTKHNLEV